MMFDPMQFAMSMIQRNPNIANNPQAREFIAVIQNGDAERGKMIAQNLCKSYGVTEEDAVRQARNFFHI